jgi:hypothetical protein
MKGSSPAQANRKRNKTIVATGISFSATLPKKNPAPPEGARRCKGQDRDDTTVPLEHSFRF